MNQAKLSRIELESYQNQGNGMVSGKYLRFYCPIHEGDHQRSFSLDPDKGSFRCFSCGVFGYLEENKREWVEEKKRSKADNPTTRQYTSDNPTTRQALKNEKRQVLKSTLPLKSEVSDLKPKIDFSLKRNEFQKALPKSVGEKYLKERGISLKLALEYGVGYAEYGTWPHQKDGKWVMQSKMGRIVFPHSTPEGTIINLYGRAVEKDDYVPSKAEKHAHLPGKKGIFNATALKEERVFICESAFNALSLISAGYKNSCALFGLNGVPWDWLKAKRIVFCLDPDSAGRKQEKELLWEGKLRGYEVFFLPDKTYGKFNDLNEVWRAEGKIDIGEWSEKKDFPWYNKIREWPNEFCEEWEERSAILEFEGGLNRKDAEEKAFEEIHEKIKSKQN